ncbi:acyl carrier protein [Micromonospora sp. NPDC005215]|uniref:acyl carrier protein n=1 Tax=Micromonospora sp. NPDC005215 TaxID=3157024 RepID=UPI00339DEB5B
MDRLQALAVIREVAVEVLVVEPEAVTEDADFRKDLDAESLDLVELLMALEDRLGIRLPEDGLRGINTVGQALDMVLDGGAGDVTEGGVVAEGAGVVGEAERKTPA